MRSALRGRAPGPVPESLPSDVADALLPAPAEGTFLIRGKPGRGIAFTVLNGSGHAADGDAKVASALLTALEAGSLLSTPFRYHASAPGRLFVARGARRAFDRGDAEFLRHVVEQVVPVLDNLRLVDRLASDAATEERRRIALDLHDSVIQPYLGLRLGLSAARAALAGGRAEEAGTHVERLVELADGEIDTLRGYVRELRAEGVQGADLEGSVRRFCRRFSEATGIRVEVAAAAAPVDDRIASEVFQMVAEALSNVRRHSEAARAEVHLESAGGMLRLVVTNDGAHPEPQSFFPRSLAERAASLGGNVNVARPAPGTTAVRVEIPL
jgi:signal transduction histidine kinase